MHKVSPNILNHDFSPEKQNRILATDFVYLPMANGAMYYNCTIIDLYDRSVVAALNVAAITADLAIQTLRKALERHILGKGLYCTVTKVRNLPPRISRNFVRKIMSSKA